MEPVRPVDFHELVGVEDPSVSPAGDRIAFVRRTPDDDESYETSIHEANLETAEVRRLTVTDGSDSQPRYRPDGDTLAFVSDRLTDDDRPQVWLLPLSGGEARQVTEVAGGVSGLEWSPTGEHLLFAQQVTADDAAADRDERVEPDFEPDTPDPRVIDRTIYRANERYFDGRRSRLYVLDLESETVSRLSPFAERDQQFATWGDASTVYFIEALGDDPDDSLEFALNSIDLADGAVETVSTFEGFVGGLAADDDDVVLGVAPLPRPTLNQAELLHVDATTGESTTLTGDLDRTIAGPVVLDDDASDVLFVTPDEGSVTVRRVPLSGGDVETLAGMDATTATFDIAGDTLATVQSAWDHPDELFVTDLATDTEERMTELNAAYLEDHAVSEPEPLRIDGQDGTAIQGWLLTPPEVVDAEAPYPMVLEIHGGPHSMWTTSGTMWHEFQSLAGAGYAVCWTNPRGSIGYGEDFAAAIADDWGDTTHDDLMAAVDAVVGRDEIDAEQLFVTGGSFGGYQTAWSIGRTDRFEAAVSQRGVYDLPAFFGVTDAYRLIESEFDATPWTDHAGLYDRSPTSLVTSVDTPTLVIHSDDDYRTPAATAEMYYRALRKLEVPTRLVRYPREGHELSRSGEPGHRVDRIERIIRWFDGYATHTDVAPPLERPPNDGLSCADDETDDES